jgi:hypothetical protein
VIAVKQSVCIKSVKENSQRPYSNLVPTGIDFSVRGEFSFVNDQLVPGGKRDPDLFLEILEKQAKFLYKDNQASQRPQIGNIYIH